LDLDSQLKDALGELKSAMSAEIDVKVAQTTLGLEQELASMKVAGLFGRQDATAGPMGPAGGPGELLTKEHSFASTVADRFGGRELRAARLGAMLSSLVTGEQDHLRDIEKAAMSEGVNSAGGYVVPDILAGEVIDQARARARVVEAGARVLPMDSDVVFIPKLASDPVAQWKAENAAVADSPPTFERVTLQSKTAAVLCTMSRELFEDATPVGFAAIENALTTSVAQAVDYAALRGTGTGSEPRGILHTAGINTLAFGGANGATPTDYDFLLDAIGNVWDANGEPTAAIYSSRTATTLAKLKTGLAGDKTQLTPPHEVQAISRLVSNQVPNTLTVGTSSNCSEAYVGDFRQLVIGVRPTLRVRFETSTDLGLGSLQVVMVAWIRADVALMQPSHFTVVSGIRG
jgi:HK97 family phage major capsid protein